MITNGYCNVEELQAAIDPEGAASFAGGDRENMEIAIEAASRWIDEYCGTWFYASSETRYYTADWHDLVYIDDLLSVTTLKTDDNGDGVHETTWAATDYIPEPRNNPLRSRPYRQLRVNVNGVNAFPRDVVDGVEITGSFGYSTAAPLNVKQACLLIAHRLYRRKDAIFGVAGTPGLGVTVIQAKIAADSDVQQLLQAIDTRRV